MWHLARESRSPCRGSEKCEDRLELEYFRGDDGPVVVPVVLMLSAEPI